MGADSAGRPGLVAVAKGENGDLVIVNLFADDEAHTNFGRNLGGPLEAVGLRGPELEHLEVLKVEWATSDG